MNHYPKISIQHAYEIFEDFKIDKIDESKINKLTQGEFSNENHKTIILESIYRIGELAENLHLDPTLNNSKFDAKAARLFYEESKIQKDWARDPDFWRWLIFSEYCAGASLIDRRYGSGGIKGSAFNKYYQFGRLSDGFFSSIWMRANAMLCENEADHLKLIEFEDLNFWNYILGGELVSYKNIIRALIKIIDKYKISVGDPKDNNTPIGYRDIFMELRRRSSNTALDLLTEEQAYQFLEDLWEERDYWSLNN